ncbi:MAG: hypothetical protein M1823_002556 [Watsoniomyces obsoletus]|nr:MAG: hypothetical protein M1823_002556 [Watsoniomyces obsoletus]
MANGSSMLPDMKLQIWVLPATGTTSRERSIQAMPTPVAPPGSRPFLERCPPDITLDQLCARICARHDRIYPEQPSLNIKKLQDFYDLDLDLSYVVSDVFKDRDDAGPNPFSSIVKVIQVPEKRQSSIPPQSALRPRQISGSGRKRARVSSSGEGWRGSGVFVKQENPESLGPLPDDDDERQLSVKRPRLDQIDTSSNPDVDETDQPIASRERDSPEVEVEVAPSVASPHASKPQAQRHTFQSTGLYPLFNRTSEPGTRSRDTLSEDPPRQTDGGASPILGVLPRKNRDPSQPSQVREEDVQLQAVQDSRRANPLLANQGGQRGDPMDVDQKKESISVPTTRNKRKRGGSTMIKSDADDDIFAPPESADDTDELLMPPPISTRLRRTAAGRKRAKATPAKDELANAQPKSTLDQPAAVETPSLLKPAAPSSDATPRAPENARNSSNSIKVPQKTPTLRKSPSVQMLSEKSLSVKPTELTDDPIETDNDERLVFSTTKGKDGNMRPEAAAEPRGLGRKRPQRKAAAKSVSSQVNKSGELKESGEDQRPSKRTKRGSDSAKKKPSKSAEFVQSSAEEESAHRPKEPSIMADVRNEAQKSTSTSALPAAQIEEGKTTKAKPKRKRETKPRSKKVENDAGGKPNGGQGELQTKVTEPPQTEVLERPEQKPDEGSKDLKDPSEEVAKKAVASKQMIAPEHKMTDAADGKETAKDEAKQKRPEEQPKIATAAVEKKLNQEAKEDTDEWEAIVAAKRQLIENSEREKKAWEEKMAAQMRPRELLTPTVARFSQMESKPQVSTTPATDGRFGPSHGTLDKTGKVNGGDVGGDASASSVKSSKRTVSFVDEAPPRGDIRALFNDAKGAIVPRDQKPMTETKVFEEKESVKPTKSEGLAQLKMNFDLEQKSEKKESPHATKSKGPVKITKDQLPKEEATERNSSSLAPPVVKETPIYPPGMNVKHFLSAAVKLNDEGSQMQSKAGGKAPAKPRQRSKKTTEPEPEPRPKTARKRPVNGRFVGSQSVADGQPSKAARKVTKIEEIVISSDDDKSISSYYSSGGEESKDKAERVMSKDATTINAPKSDRVDKSNDPVDEQPATDIPTQPVQAVEAKTNPKSVSQDLPAPALDQPTPSITRSPSRSPARFLSRTPSVGSLGDEQDGPKEPSASHAADMTNDKTIEYDGNESGDNILKTKATKKSTPASADTSSSSSSESGDSEASLESTPSPTNQQALDKIMQQKTRQSMEPSSSLRPREKEKEKEKTADKQLTKPAATLHSSATTSTTDDDENEVPTSAQRPTDHQFVSVTEVRESHHLSRSNQQQATLVNNSMTQEEPPPSSARITGGGATRTFIPPSTSLRTFGSQLSSQLQETLLQQQQTISAPPTGLHRPGTTSNNNSSIKIKIPGIYSSSNDDDDSSSISSSSVSSSSEEDDVDHDKGSDKDVKLAQNGSVMNGGSKPEEEEEDATTTSPTDSHNKELILNRGRRSRGGKNKHHHPAKPPLPGQGPGPGDDNISPSELERAGNGSGSGGVGSKKEEKKMEKETNEVAKRVSGLLKGMIPPFLGGGSGNSSAGLGVGAGVGGGVGGAGAGNRKIKEPPLRRPSNASSHSQLLRGSPIGSISGSVSVSQSQSKAKGVSKKRVRKARG